MNTRVRFAEPLVLTISESTAQECRAQGFRHVRDVSSPHLLLDSEGRLLPELDYFESYVVLIPHGGENLRDTIALNVGDDLANGRTCRRNPQTFRL